MKRMLVIAVALAATGAHAEDNYTGLFGAYGGYGTVSDINYENYPFEQTSIGILLGREIDLGEIYVFSEISLRAGTGSDMIYSYVNGSPWNPASGRSYLKEEAAVAASFGVGKRTGRVSVFAKAGAGLSFFDEKFFVSPGQGFKEWSENGQYQTLVFTAAAGVQYDIDRYFIRAEAEYRHMTDPEWYDLDHVGIVGTLGVRF